MIITRPTLLLDEQRCRANIRRMAEKARRHHLIFRPHFKTHQSHEVGRWFRDEGVEACTVSSVSMASYFAADGWKDITVAFPLNFLEAEEINRLASAIRLNILAVNPEALRGLLGKLTAEVGVFIEVDCGYHRTGVDASDAQTFEAILSLVDASPLLNFRGLLTHAGHSYACRSGIEILTIHQQTTQVLKKVAARLRTRYPDLVVSVGDTPTCSAANDFSGVQEIRPGNFVFYDVTQRVIGACTEENIAVALACPVVAVYLSRGEIIVHGGGVHLSKDFLKNEDGSASFGRVVRMTEQGWSLPTTGMTVKSLSQEHGVIRAGETDCASVKPGDVLGILPVHSCMTADVMTEYYTLAGGRIRMMPKAE
jgi:D-serine deaminase-like pyridoxal phosphate-dependent protein